MIGHSLGRMGPALGVWVTALGVWVQPWAYGSQPILKGYGARETGHAKDPRTVVCAGMFPRTSGVSAVVSAEHRVAAPTGGAAGLIADLTSCEGKHAKPPRKNQISYLAERFSCTDSHIRSILNKYGARKTGYGLQARAV